MTERMLAMVGGLRVQLPARSAISTSGADPQGRTGQLGKGSTHLIKVAAEAAVGTRSRTCSGSIIRRPTDLRPRLHPRQRPRRRHVAALERLIHGRANSRSQSARPSSQVE